MSKDNDQADDDQEGPDEWVIAGWKYSYAVELLFVRHRELKPDSSGWLCTIAFDAYRWKSYHAARKFQRAHPILQHCQVMNLSEIRRLCELRREHMNVLPGT
jgi:hypothetical protein